MFGYAYFYVILVLPPLGVEDRAGCFAWFVFLVSGNINVALPHGDMGLSAVSDCGIF